MCVLLFAGLRRLLPVTAEVSAEIVESTHGVDSGLSLIESLPKLVWDVFNIYGFRGIAFGLAYIVFVFVYATVRLGPLLICRDSVGELD